MSVKADFRAKISTDELKNYRWRKDQLPERNNNLKCGPRKKQSFRIHTETRDRAERRNRQIHNQNCKQYYLPFSNW